MGRAILKINTSAAGGVSGNLDLAGRVATGKTQQNDVCLVNYRFYMKYIKDLMTKAAIAKIRAYEAHQQEAVTVGDDDEVVRLQKMIDEWRIILNGLLND